MGEHELN